MAWTDELATVVEAAGKAAAQLGLTPPVSSAAATAAVPVPLEAILADDGAGWCSTAPFCIGLLDEPHMQRQRGLEMDPIRLGGVLVVGGPTPGPARLW